MTEASRHRATFPLFPAAAPTDGALRSSTACAAGGRRPDFTGRTYYPITPTGGATPTTG